MVTAVLVFGKVDIDGIEALGELVVEQRIALVTQGDGKFLREVGCDNNTLWHILQFQGDLDIYFVLTVKRLFQPEQGGNKQEKQKSKDLPAVFA